MMYELVVTLALSLLAGVCSIKSLTAGVQMIDSAARLSFLTREAAACNLALQKLMGDSTGFTLYATPDDARASNAAAVMKENAAAVRLTFPDGRAAIVYFDASDRRLYFENVTPGDSKWVIGSGFDSVGFHLTDPQDPQVSGLIVVTLDKGGRRVPCYVERF